MSETVKFKRLHPLAQVPQYQTMGASGFDFHAVEDATLKRGQVSLVSTGLAVEIPEGYEIQVRARSGLAVKAGVFLVNGIGTIDSDYRGEVKIIMSTCLDSEVQIKVGDRIAQGVLVKVERAQLEFAEDLQTTERNAGGFGSTGIGA